MTIMVTFGKFGGFYANFSTFAWRVCLGWMALTFVFADLDTVLWDMMQRDQSN